jgi:hypothetical protein
MTASYVTQYGLHSKGPIKQYFPLILFYLVLGLEILMPKYKVSPEETNNYRRMGIGWSADFTTETANYCLVLEGLGEGDYQSVGPGPLSKRSPQQILYFCTPVSLS